MQVLQVTGLSFAQFNRSFKETYKRKNIIAKGLTTKILIENSIFNSSMEFIWYSKRDSFLRWGIRKVGSREEACWIEPARGLWILQPVVSQDRRPVVLQVDFLFCLFNHVRCPVSLLARWPVVVQHKYASSFSTHTRLLVLQLK